VDAGDCPRTLLRWELGAESALGGDVFLGASERAEGELFCGGSFCQPDGELVIGAVDEVVVVAWVFLFVQGAWGWVEEGALCMNVVGTGKNCDGSEKQGDFLGMRSSSVGVVAKATKN
jgi:hypothetical protein